MTRYTVGAVAMSRYLVDQLPDGTDQLFARAETGLEVLEAPAVTVSETIWAATQKSTVGRVKIETTPDAVVRGLVSDGPVTVAPTGEQDLAAFGSLLNQRTLHDARLVANHRVRGTEAIVTNDTAMTSEPTVWE